MKQLQNINLSLTIKMQFTKRPYSYLGICDTSTIDLIKQSHFICGFKILQKLM